MDVCVRCGACADKCHFFIGGGDPYILSKLTDDSLVYGFRDTLVAPIADQTFWEFPGEARWVYQPIN